MNYKFILNVYHYFEAAVHKFSYKKMFWKYAANLQHNTHAEVQFRQSWKAALLKSNFGMGVLP